MAEQRTIGALIKAYRNIHGVTMDDICKEGNFSKSTISNLEASVYASDIVKDDEEQKSVTVNICEKLARFMGMKLSEFFAIVESIEQEKNVNFIHLVYFKLSEFYLKRNKV